MQFFTIGVYNSTEAEFFSKLTENNIDTFCDIRQRRGVRGAKYAFVNSKRLQYKLGQLGIYYLHLTELAPTAEIRELQKNADKENGELKRDRIGLGEVFKEAYRSQILEVADFDTIFQRLERLESKKIVFFCVEEVPEACHRSLVLQRINLEYNFKITNL